MTCKTCSNRVDRECTILRNLLLIMCRTDNKQNVLGKKLLIKDKTLDTFKCNFYEVKK